MLLNWPKETRRHLAEYRRNIDWLAGISVSISVFLLVRVSHQRPNITFLLLVIGFGSLLSSFVMLIKPPSPFRLMWSVPRDLDDLNEEDLRVLTYLRSHEAIKLYLFTCVGLGCFLFLLCIADWYVIRRTPPSWMLTWQDIVFSSLFAFFLYFIPLYAMQLAVVHAWIARHFQEIIEFYPPWPKDRQF